MNLRKWKAGRGAEKKGKNRKKEINKEKKIKGKKRINDLANNKPIS